MAYTRPSLNAKFITDVYLVSRFRALASLHPLAHTLPLVGVQSQKQSDFHLVGIRTIYYMLHVHVRLLWPNAHIYGGNLIFFIFPAYFSLCICFSLAPLLPCLFLPLLSELCFNACVFIGHD